MGKLAALFSGPALWYIVGAVALAVLGYIGVQKVQLVYAKHQLTEERAKTATERADRAEAAASATALKLKESERRESAQQGIINATKPALETARAAADRLPALDDRVRTLAAALGSCRRAGSGDPAAAGGSAPTEETARVLAELQRSADAAERARNRFADEAAAAGERCEQLYDSLKPGPALVGAE